MKLLIVFIFPLFVLGQSPIEGKFCSPRGYAGYCLEFLEMDSVEYNYWSCLVNYDKKGTYEIIDDSLILTFESNPKTIPQKYLDTSYASIVATNCKTDSLELEISVGVIGIEGLAPFVDLVLTKVSNNLNDTLVKTTTDIDGRTTLKIPRINDSLKLTASFVATKSKDIIFNPDSCAIIGFNLAQTESYDTDFNRLTFKINSIKKQKLQLIEEGSEFEVELKRK